MEHLISFFAKRKLPDGNVNRAEGKMSVTERLWSCICCLRLFRVLESAFVNKSSSHRFLGTWVWVVLFINFSEVWCPKLVNSAFFRTDLSATSLMPPLSSLPCLHPFPGVFVLFQLSCIMSWKSITKICKMHFRTQLGGGQANLLRFGEKKVYVLPRLL